VFCLARSLLGLGTTDSSAVITALPRPHEKEIQFIIKEVILMCDGCVMDGFVLSRLHFV